MRPTGIATSETITRISDDDAAYRPGGVRRQDPRAGRLQDRSARNRNHPAGLGTNRQSGARQAGLDIRIDCRSFADQGVDREATVHLGPVASGMERNGEGSDLGDRNRAASARNGERERAESDRAAVSAEIIDLAAERAAARSGARVARRDPDEQPAEDPRYPHREAVDLQPRRPQPGAGEGYSRSEGAGSAQRSDLALPEVVGLKESEVAPVSRYTTRAVIGR